MLLLEMDIEEKRKRLDAAMEKSRWTWRKLGAHVGKNYATIQKWMLLDPKNEKEETRQGELLAMLNLSPEQKGPPSWRAFLFPVTPAPITPPSASTPRSDR
jgi:hypothetical protein